MNARYFLDQSFRLLFQDKPYDIAKANPTPKVEAPAPRQDQQFTPGVMARMFPKPIVSPEYNQDGSVTFRYKSDNASQVELECQMFSGHKPMTKDADGIWSITVTPEVPDIYPYSFFVDGTQLNDPNNMYLFPNENFKGNLVDVKGKEPGVQDIQKVPQGKVSYCYYFSKQFGIERPMCVYTPAGYDPAGKEKLPVLYLIHGMTDTYETWFKVGHANNILDNLIAQGKAKRMIVVMPYANPAPELRIQGKGEQYNLMDAKQIANEIVKEVMPYIEQNYNVLTDADHRAVAGFSLGGRQCLATGFGNPDLFHYVAAYAPAIFGDEYKQNFSNGTYAPISDLKSKLKFMFLGTGRDDFLIEASRGFDAYLTEAPQDSVHTENLHIITINSCLNDIIRCSIRDILGYNCLKKSNRDLILLTCKDKSHLCSIKFRISNIHDACSSIFCCFFIILNSSINNFKLFSVKFCKLLFCKSIRACKDFRSRFYPCRTILRISKQS